VQTTYDYIQINASAKPESFLTMMETIATAVGNPQIDKGNNGQTACGSLARKWPDVESDPDTRRSGRCRPLFGHFPYAGRYWNNGTSQKIEFADLLDARQRFLTADNATVAISATLIGRWP
jgi:predicted Zn-dependent peptidase